MRILGGLSFCFLLLALAAVAQNTIQSEIGLLSEIQQSPNDPELRDRLGELYLSESLYDKAVQSFQTAISIDPADTRGRYDLGLTFETTGQYENAVKAYQDALAWSAYPLNFRLGVCYGKLGRYKEALASLQAVKQQRDAPGVHYALAISLAGLKRYGKAIQELGAAQNMDLNFRKGKEFFMDFRDLENVELQWREKERKRNLIEITGWITLMTVLVLLSYYARPFFKKQKLLHWKKLR